MSGPQPGTTSPPKASYSAIQLIVDDVSDKLSHSKLINLVGAFTGSTLMFLLTVLDKMSEGYFGLYMAAVGLTAVGYRYVAKPDATTSLSPKPATE